jgi:adenosylcobinamide-GDP ribazoletransferase
MKTRPMLSLISFFTKIPAQGSLEKASRETFLLPLIALIISVPAGSIFYIFIFLPSLIRALFGIITIYVINGLIHIDGLADFSDGLMAKGSTEKKIKAMKDVNTGIAGTFSVVIIILIEIFSLYSLRTSLFNIFGFFIISELSAKFSIMGGLMNSPRGEGLGSHFQRNFKWWFIPLGIILTLPLIFAFQFYYFISFLGFPVSILISYISKKNFGMVNGDCIGAMNEIARSITMVVLCLVL